jgi:hypothetical protein
MRSWGRRGGSMLAERSIYWELMNEPAVFGCEHDDDVERRRLDRGLH